MGIKNVLIVDDDPDVLNMLERMLKNLAYNTFVAANGEIAIDIILKNKVDVVVSDLVMPEMDGMELLKRVKSQKRDIPFVMITGHPTIETAVEDRRRSRPFVAAGRRRTRLPARAAGRG